MQIQYRVVGYHRQTGSRVVFGSYWTAREGYSAFDIITTKPKTLAVYNKIELTAPLFGRVVGRYEEGAKTGNGI
jgi:hypothetical protein